MSVDDTQLSRVDDAARVASMHTFLRPASKLGLYGVKPGYVLNPYIRTFFVVFPVLGNFGSSDP